MLGPEPAPIPPLLATPELKSERLRIPTDLDFDGVPGLSNEIKGRLKLARPETIGQASRLSGITPAAVANLMIFLRMNDRRGGVEKGFTKE